MHTGPSPAERAGSPFIHRHYNAATELRRTETEPSPCAWSGLSNVTQPHTAACLQPLGDPLSTRSNTLRLVALFGLFTACDPTPKPVEPTVSPLTTITVASGNIFAADFGDATFTYWIVDANTGAIAQSGTHPASNVDVVLNDAAGAYITTPSTTSAPPYTVSLDGSVLPGGVLSYLAPDTDAFVDLHASVGTTMAARHADMLVQADEVVTTFEADLQAVQEHTATLVATDVMRARDELSACMPLLQDTDDLDIIASGAAGPPAYVADLEALATDLEAEVAADETVAQGNALTLQSITPDDAQIEADVLACLDLEVWGDEIEADLDKLISKAIIDEDWTYDGRRRDEGEIDDEGWADTENQLDELRARYEAMGDELEACIIEAVGAEPQILLDDITPDPYEAIGASAELIGTSVTADAESCEADLRVAFADYIDQDEPGGDVDPAVYHAALDHALPVLYAMGGQDLLDEDATSTTTAPSSTASSAMLVDNSSFDACMATTTVFQFNVLGFGVAIGTPFDDTIRGADVSTGFEVMIGGMGDDCINGLAGHELIIGGRGNDELHGGDQHELIFGGRDDDNIFLGEGDTYSFPVWAAPPTTLEINLGSVAFGGRGNDSISGSDPDYDPADDTDFGFTDVIFGDGLTDATAGNDNINGGAGIDLLFGQWGDDNIENALPGHLVLDVAATGTTPATTIDVEMGSLFFGGRGDDTFGGSTSFDLLFGASGDDDGGAGAGFDLVFGGPDNDTISGQDGVDFVFGGAGDDEMNGGDGPDLVAGNRGDDVVGGDAGILDLVFGGLGDDRVNGGDGMDLAFGAGGQDIVEGDDGFDLVFGGDLADTVRGGNGLDLLFGSTGRDLLEGGDGTDLVFGGDETDIVRGNDGLDVLFAGDGEDWVEGGNGFDLVWSAADTDAVFGGDGLDVLFAGEGDDCMWGETGTDLMFGSDGADYMSGGPDLDLVFGGAEDDQLYGDDGVDFLSGGDGSDWAYGGNGLDLIWGNADQDNLFGNAGFDLMFGGDAMDCLDAGADFDIATGGDGADIVHAASVAWGGEGEDQLAVDNAGFGGDADDDILAMGGVAALLLGGSGADHLWVTSAAGITFGFAGDGDDTLSATGATPVGSSAPRRFFFGGDGADWMHGSLGKSRMFGGHGDDTMVADPDGTSTNDDERDWVFGNKDSDALYGDSSSKRDLMLRGSGNDPSRQWDAWPSTTPSWGTVHAQPSLATCPAAPAMTVCESMKEPPAEVGAPE